MEDYVTDTKYLLKYEFKYVLEYIHHKLIRLMNEIINPFKKIRNFLICFYKMIAYTVKGYIVSRDEIMINLYERHSQYMFFKSVRWGFWIWHKLSQNIQIMKIKTLSIQVFIVKIIYITSNLNNHLCFLSTLIESSCLNTIWKHKIFKLWRR